MLFTNYFLSLQKPRYFWRSNQIVESIINLFLDAHGKLKQVEHTSRLFCGINGNWNQDWILKENEYLYRWFKRKQWNDCFLLFHTKSHYFRIGFPLFKFAMWDIQFNHTVWGDNMIPFSTLFRIVKISFLYR